MRGDSVWMQPPYYVHQMIARSQREHVLRATTSGGNAAIEATAFGDMRGTSLHIVNASNEAVIYDIDFGNTVANASVAVTTLGPDRGTAVNTSGNPRTIVPAATETRLDQRGRLTFRIAPRSFTTLAVNRR